MKTVSCPFLLTLLLAVTAAGAPAAADTKSASGRITVAFEHPEKYLDLKDNANDFENERGRERYLPRLRDHIVEEANRLLPAGQKLAVTFTDIDLAGDFEPWRGFEFIDVRIVKDLYIPRCTFSFKLTDDSGRVLKEGERKLADFSFQFGANRGFPDDTLRYEKSMLSDWMRNEFGVRKR